MYPDYPPMLVNFFGKHLLGIPQPGDSKDAIGMWELAKVAKRIPYWNHNIPDSLPSHKQVELRTILEKRALREFQRPWDTRHITGIDNIPQLFDCEQIAKARNDEANKFKYCAPKQRLFRKEFLQSKIKQQKAAEAPPSTVQNSPDISATTVAEVDQSND